MNKQKKEDKNHIKKLLKELNINFETMRSDKELIYMIEYLPNEFKNFIEAIPILLIYSLEEKILIAICPNIYKMKKGDSTLNIFYALNKTNKTLSSGNVILDKKHIIYRYQEKFSSINYISKDKLINIFNDIILASIYACTEIKRMKNNEE